MKRFAGDRNPNWKGGRLPISQRIRACAKNRKLIASILRRDKHTCQVCGQVGGDLEVDHKIPFSDIMDGFLQKYKVLDVRLFQDELFSIGLKYKPFWNRDNERTLCRKCNWERQIERNRHTKSEIGTLSPPQEAWQEALKGDGVATELCFVFRPSDRSKIERLLQ